MPFHKTFGVDLGTSMGEDLFLPAGHHLNGKEHDCHPERKTDSGCRQ